MSQGNQAEAKTTSIEELLKMNPFTIPVFQRPYSWDAEKVETLLDDIMECCAQKDENGKFRELDELELFLGPVVLYSKEGKQIIDGQQRITTLTLLVHMLYLEFASKRDCADNEDEKDGYKEILSRLSKLIWQSTVDPTTGRKTYTEHKPALMSRAISQEVEDKFKDIISCDRYEDNAEKKYNDIVEYAKGKKAIKSNYVINNAVIYNKLQNILRQVNAERFLNFLLDHCVVMCVDCKSEEASLKIFDTLNTRGMQLCDADIFKAAIYQGFKEKAAIFECVKNEDKAKEVFSEKWEYFESLSKDCKIGGSNEDPRNKMFDYLRLSVAEPNDQKKSLRGYFSESDPGKNLLKDPNIFDKLIPLAAFWYVLSDSPDNNVNDKNTVRKIKNLLDSNFDLRKYLHVLCQINAPDYWREVISVYFLKNYKNEWITTEAQIENEDLKQENEDLKHEQEIFTKNFADAAKKILAYNVFIGLTSTGRDSIRSGMRGLFNCIGEEKAMQLRIQENEYKNSRNKVEKALEAPNKDNDYEDQHCKGTTNLPRAIVLLHAYLNDNQKELIKEFDVEHIFPRKWANELKNVEKPDEIGCPPSWSKEYATQCAEAFGNKVALEKDINIAVSAKAFALKEGIYKTRKNKTGGQAGTQIADAQELTSKWGNSDKKVIVLDYEEHIIPRNIEFAKRIMDFLDETMGYTEVTSTPNDIS